MLRKKQKLGDDMDFLKELGIDDITINKIKENNLPSIVRQFINDRENAKKIIKYFQDKGIQVVDDLLIRRLEIFSIDYNRLISAFDKFNNDVLIALINEDISAINFL